MSIQFVIATLGAVMKLMFAALAIILAAIMPPLTQAEIVRRLGLVEGRWVTHLTIEAIDVQALDKSKPLTPAAANAIKAATGRQTDTEDCVTMLVATPRTIVLPGFTLKGWESADWSASGGKLTLTTESKSTPLKSRMKLSSDYTPTAMHSVILSDVQNVMANVHVQTRLDSRFAGPCAG